MIRLLSSVVLLLLAAGCGGGGGGGGTPAAPFSIFAGAAAGDLDGDGLTDIAASVQTEAPGGVRTASVVVLVQRADSPGAFRRLGTYALGSDAEGVALGDVTGDRILDVLVAGGNENRVYLLANDGRGGLSPPRRTPTCADARNVDVADISSDQRADVTVACLESIAYHPQDPDVPGTLLPGTELEPGSWDVSAVDMNSDMLPDLVTPAQAFRSGRARYYLQLPVLDTEFDSGQEVKVDYDVYGVTVADLNKDDLLDIIVFGSPLRQNLSFRGRYTVFLQASSSLGLFSSLDDVKIDESFPTYGVASDFDGDGLVDMALAVQNEEGGRPGQVEVFRAFAGTGTFLPNGIYPLPGQADLPNHFMKGISVADLDQDGIDDLLVVSDEIFALFQLPGSNGRFTEAVRLASP